MKSFFMMAVAVILALPTLVDAENSHTDDISALYIKHPDNIICTSLYIDSVTAISNLFNAPVLFEDNERYYKGKGWTNDDEKLGLGPGYIKYSTYIGRNLAELVNCSIPMVMYRELSPDIPVDITDYARNKLESLGLTVKLVHSQMYKEETLLSSVDDAFKYVDESIISDCYVLCYACNESGIPVYNDGYYSDVYGQGFEGSRILIIMTNDGMQYLSASNLYQTVALRHISHPLLNASEAKAIVENYYALYNTDICMQRLEYIKTAIGGNNPQDMFMLVPAWIFTQRSTFNIGEKEQVITYEDFAIINAHTGEEY